MHRRGTGDSLLDEATIVELEKLDGMMLGHLTTLYFDQAAGQMAALSDAIDDSEFGTAGLLAHKLKGGSATLGASRVAEILADIEGAVRGAERREAKELLTLLWRALSDTQTAFARRPAATTQP